MKKLIAVNVKVTKDSTPDIKKGVETLRRNDVLVGVPQDKDRSSTNAEQQLGTTKRQAYTITSGPLRGKSVKPKITNAVLAYIHNNGSPSQNIPARATLEPGIKDAQAKITDYMGQIGEAALDGDLARVDRGLNIVGLTAQNAVKLRIRSNTPPPLSKKTLEARQRRGVTRTNTLVDTAQYLNAHTYIVRHNKGK